MLPNAVLVGSKEEVGRPSRTSGSSTASLCFWSQDGELTTNAVLSRTGVALALFAIGLERKGDPLPHNSRGRVQHPRRSPIRSRTIGRARGCVDGRRRDPHRSEAHNVERQGVASGERGGHVLPHVLIVHGVHA